MLERLQKILSKYGIASRRQAEELILAGKVLVNGKAVRLGDRADIEEDEIVVNGQKLINQQNTKQNLVYYLVNKPRGYVCTVKDKHTDKKVIDLAPSLPKVWPVGRLDKDSSGLIILTNDGELTNQLTHPKFKHEKEYEVVVNKALTKYFLQKMKQGVKLSEGIAQADKVSKIGEYKFKIVLHQGWKRQIRRMSRQLGYQVVELKRIRIGKIKLGNLKEGEFKAISVDKQRVKSNTQNLINKTQH